jgi:hypothetical protein
VHERTKREIFGRAEEQMAEVLDHAKVRDGRVEATARALDMACHDVKAGSPDDADVELYSDELHEEFKRHLEKA